MRLDGAVALVTGASSGIGAATAVALAGAGASLLLSGRDEARLAEVAGRTGGTVLGGDLAAPGGAAGLAEQALAAARGGIDVLVNNAGLGWAGPVGEIPAAKVTELATVNLAAPIELTRLLVPGMAERGRGVAVSVIVPGVIDTPFFARRGTPYGRARPAPIPAGRVAAAIVSALEHERPVVYVPGWLRFPAWLHGTAPGAFRALAARFGDPGY